MTAPRTGAAHSHHELVSSAVLPLGGPGNENGIHMAVQVSGWVPR
jgi:hypothetical protein